MTVRAALEAARVSFAPSRGPASGDNTGSLEWVPLDPALRTSRLRGERMWEATAHVLQAATGRPELTGQALVGEARRVELLTLSDAHALIALYGWLERLRDEAAPASGAETTSDAMSDALSDALSATDAPSATEREVAREAWLALEHVSASANTNDATRRDQASRDMPRAANARRETSRDAAMPSMASPSMASPSTEFSSSALPAASPQATRIDAAARPWYQRVPVIAGALALTVSVAVGVWYARRELPSADFRDGLTAYERGAREVARMSFARAAQRAPDDARPLVYLGRLAREEGDMARAKRFLESAVRAEPSSALAHRELASALLADGQPELARRFYVYALERDPDDRLAQGFLGCALYRLGRIEEARRWYDRAGVGDWTNCLLPSPPAPTS